MDAYVIVMFHTSSSSQKSGRMATFIVYSFVRIQAGWTDRLCSLSRLRQPPGRSAFLLSLGSRNLSSMAEEVPPRAADAHED